MSKISPHLWYTDKADEDWPLWRALANLAAQARWADEGQRSRPRQAGKRGDAEDGEVRYRRTRTRSEWL